jgi:hypothetical protein
VTGLLFVAMLLVMIAGRFLHLNLRTKVSGPADVFYCWFGRRAAGFSSEKDMVIYVLDLNSASAIETEVMLKCARLLGLVREVP